MRPAAAIEGLRFGMLLVVSRHSTSRNGRVRWSCLCDCGNTKNILGTHLVSGKINSCGCLSKRTLKENPNWKGFGNISGHHFQLLNHAASGKTRKKIEFLVSIEYLSDLFDAQEGRCALSGMPLVILLPSDQDALRTASLDRVDNTIGYIEGNVQWVHKEVNMMKNKLDQDLFIRWCNTIAEYQGLPQYD